MPSMPHTGCSNIGQSQLQSGDQIRLSPIKKSAMDGSQLNTGPIHPLEQRKVPSQVNNLSVSSTQPQRVWIYTTD